MRRILLISAIYMASCSTGNKSKLKIDCNENEAFRKEFFAQIDYITNNISVNQNQEFLNALNFLAMYTTVSFEEMSNYSRTYTIGSFEKDKKVWLTWYENNKCKNLKLKK